MDQRYPVGACVGGELVTTETYSVDDSDAWAARCSLSAHRAGKGTVDLIDAHHLLRQRLPAVNWSSVMTQKPSLTREAAAKSHVDSYSAHPLPR
jgi:hypothetical protein